MQNSSKRALSWLVVLAMVLSMVPVFDFSNFAITSKAAEEVTAGQANLPEGTQDIIDAAKNIQDADLAAHIEAGTCPVCGDGITWVTKTNNSGSWDIGIAATDTSYHFYLDGNNANEETGLIYSGHYNFAQTKADGQTLCIAMINNPTVDLDGYIRNSKANCEINIMGQGTIKSDGKKADGVTDASEDLGMLLFQGSNSTFNLYGGTYIYTGDGDGKLNNAVPSYGAICMNKAGNVLNIFDGVTVGPETQDRTKHLYNVVLTLGTINMYGGTIQNGVSGYTNASGNVSMASGTSFNLYGGTIKNGYTVLDANAKPYLDKAGATGTAIANIGGNVRNGGGTFNMYGGSLEDGFARNGGNGGGNLGNMANGKSNILGGTIKGGTTKGSGDNINVVSGTVTIGGSALIESGEEGARSSIYLSKDSTSKLVVNGGVIRGGKGANGGNINAGAKTTLEINGGLIENGTATTGSGGNININAGCTVTLGEGAVIQNGVAAGYGGNVHGGESFTTSAKVLNGTARKGGGNLNIAGGKTVTVAGGVVANGWVSGPWDEATGSFKTDGSTWGSNIRAWTAGVKVTGGLIYGGVHGPNKSAHNSNNIGCLASIEKTGAANVAGSTLEISGGIIVGDISTSGPSANAAGTFSCPGTTVILSGSPKILKSYKLEDGTVVNASVNGLALSSVANIADLSTDAQICVSVTKGKVFTEATENAAALAGCFTAYSGALVAAANANNQLVLQDAPKPEVGVFAPEQFGGMAYCDACLAQGKSKEAALVEWTAYNGENNSEANKREEYKEDGTIDYGAHFHLYLAEDKTYDTGNFFITYRKACFNLNGHTITAGENCSGVFSVTNMLNVFDSKGGAVVTGNSKAAGSGAVFHANGGGGAAKYSIYGGTFTKVEGNTISPIVHIGNNGGTINMYGGQIGTGDEVYAGVPAVYMQGSKRDQKDDGSNYTYDSPAAFILHDGKIYGGTHEEKSGGAFRVGSTSNSGDGIKTNSYEGVATLTVKGGEIIGGSAAYGGAIWVGKSNTLIIEGGKIHSGTASGNGGNIHVETGCTLTVSGGEIYGGEAANAGGNININGGTLTLSGDAKIYNGVAEKTGGNINTSAVTTISGNALIDNGEAKGFGGGNIQYNKGLTISGGTIQNGKATAASGASGGNLRGTGILTMTGGTVQNGYVAKSATGGGNIYATSGASVNITGGNWIGGEAYNGGNIYIYTGNLTVSGDAVIEGGKATNSGGNIFKYGSDAGYGNTNTHYVAISGNAVIKDGEAGGANGGNIYATSKLSIADNAQVLGGHAKSYGGNIYVSGLSRRGAAIPDTDPVEYEYNMEYAVFEMKGGIVKDGTATNMANANILIVNANMDMSGGEVYAAANSTANGAGLRLSSGAALYLSGDATIGCQDGVNDNCFQVQPNAKLYISGDWTGNACVQFNEYFSAGETIVTDEKYYATWGTFTSATDETTGLVTFTFNQGEGNAYTGTLIHERAPYPTIVPQADGTTAIVAAGVISESGSTWYASAAEALENYDISKDLYLYLSGDVTINEDVVIDVAGAELTLSGTGHVRGLDSRNDGYGDYGTITIADGAEITFDTDAIHPVNGYRYIGIKEGNALSFHRIEMYFTNATLRAADAGIYYKATFKADQYLSSKVECFGTVLSLNDMPDSDFECAEDINIATELGGEKFVMDENGQLDITTASVFGIVKESRTKEQNTAYAQMDIYANLYLYVVTEDGIGAYVMAEEAAKEETKGAGVAYSLVDILDLINDNWDNYSDEEKATVQEALNKWAGFITDEAVAGLQIQLDKIFPAA